MLKRKWYQFVSWILTLTMIVSFCPTVSFASYNEYVISVGEQIAYSNGEEFYFEDKILNRDARVLVPIKDFAYFMGGQFVGWNGETGEATVEIADSIFTYRTGSDEYTCNYETYYMDQEAKIIDGRLYVEARSIPDAIGELLITVTL